MSRPQISNLVVSGTSYGCFHAGGLRNPRWWLAVRCELSKQHVQHWASKYGIPIICDKLDTMASRRNISYLGRQNSEAKPISSSSLSLINMKWDLQTSIFSRRAAIDAGVLFPVRLQTSEAEARQVPDHTQMHEKKTSKYLLHPPNTP